ncbi:MAG: FAD-dependent oxidoreductase, partial [Oscillospiraceae bacterium]|nr:FAD-dependent oxidoreductase [Oscillospiraceae bacterium]
MSQIYDAEQVLDTVIGPEPEELVPDRELETDVIVVGGGLAGVSALRSATEHGAACLLFEKCDRVQGRSGAFGAIGFRGDNRYGVPLGEMRRKIAAEIVKEGGNRGDYRIVRYWAEHSAEDLEWYIQPLGDLYVMEHTADVPPPGVTYWLQANRNPLPEFLQVEKDYYPSYPGVWQFRPGGHLPCLQKNFERAVATGLAEAHFSTPVRKLLKQGDRVVGVLAVAEDGTVLRAIARRGVILATGGYTGDDALMEFYAPRSK